MKMKCSKSFFEIICWYNYESIYVKLRAKLAHINGKSMGLLLISKKFSYNYPVDGFPYYKQPKGGSKNVSWNANWI